MIEVENVSAIGVVPSDGRDDQLKVSFSLVLLGTRLLGTATMSLDYDGLWSGTELGPWIDETSITKLRASLGLDSLRETCAEIELVCRRCCEQFEDCKDD